MVKVADSVNLDQPFQEALSLDLFSLAAVQVRS